ncbi:hypothetical protein [Wohlfahrtiimonas larvae]|uniref:Fimbrial-type adhesion domain-containing protein n=1 Tax=Wohlfahrtiimonas larvae TaxID=1157986 RepID=A0ABP9MT95_9GAMM|nr:hypothetical protein [Wohlfahrtiimonas larvae]
MIFNFKRKISIVLLGIALLGNVTLADCSFSGNRTFTITMDVGLSPNSGPKTRGDLKCTFDTVITPLVNQPTDWNNFIVELKRSQYPVHGSLRDDQVVAKFRATLKTKADSRIVSTWDFDMAQKIVTKNTHSYTLKKDVEYFFEIENVVGMVIVSGGKEPIPLVSRYRPSSAYLIFPMALANFYVQGDIAYQRPPTKPTCTANAFTVVAPSQVDFKQMDINALEKDTEFVKSFVITITRKANQNCKDTTTPSITFTTSNALSEKTDAKIPERGLLFSIYREKTKRLVDFGKAYDWDSQSGLTTRAETYEGRIKKDPSTKVTPGPFGITVNYSISYR